jgi:hypothetical protein
VTGSSAHEDRAGVLDRHQGLIDQLSSEHGSQFTKAQAVYAVDQMGL